MTRLIVMGRAGPGTYRTATRTSRGTCKTARATVELPLCLGQCARRRQLQYGVQRPKRLAHARFASIASQMSCVTFRPSNRSSS
jgi:hypothetical protein